MTTKIKLTQITSTDCDLTKTFSLDSSGAVESTAIAHMTQGVARVFEIEHVGHLAAVLPMLLSNQAITCGVPRVGDTNLTTRAGAEFRQDAVARTNEAFTFPNGATLFPVDVDIDDRHAPYSSVHDVLDALEDCHPWLRKLHRVARPSSSSFVAGRGLRGVHAYFVVTAGSGVDTLAKRMQAEQWLKGKGWIKISKSGALLTRQISDATVYQPSRLMFESTPVLKGVTREVPLDQTFVERGPESARGPKVTYVDDGALDVAAMPALKEIDLRRFETMKRDKKRENLARAKAVAMNYHKENAIANGYDANEQERIALMAIRALGDEKLPTDWRVFVRGIGPQTVGQILAAGDAALGFYCADPFDSYRTNLTDAQCAKAEIVRMGDRVGIWSHKLQQFFEFTTDASANISSPLEQAAERLAGCIEYPEPMSKRGPTERNLTVALRLLLTAIDCLPRMDATTERREISDDLPTVTALQDAVSHVGCVGASVTAIKEVIKNLAHEHTFDPWKEAVLAIPQWDGVARLDTFWSDAAGAIPCEALTLTAQLMFAGIVMRQLHPGAQCPVVPVLIGEGRTGKTRFVHHIAGVLNFPPPAAVTFGDSIKMCQAACVSPVAELSEMSGMGKRDMEDIKTWVTDTEDVYRAPYGEFAVAHKRRFVPIGTANKYELNRDETGNRRFMPVLITQEIDPKWRLEGLQLFAEARERFCRDLDVYNALANDCAAAVKAFNDAAMLRGEGMPVSDLDDLMPPILKGCMDQSGKRMVRSPDIRAKLDGTTSGKIIRAHHIAAWLRSRGWRARKSNGQTVYDAPDGAFDDEMNNVLPFTNNPFTREATA